MDVGIQDKVSIPFFKKLNPSLGFFYIPFVILVIVGASNAVNLTDGLDGLAIGPSIISAGTYMLFAYLAGHIKIANYLQIQYVPGAGELTIFCGAMAGAGIGLLWYNTYPAQVFMGDTGSLSLGAALGAVAVMVKQEIVLALVGGVLSWRRVSVILQVYFFKTTRSGSFRMAPSTITSVSKGGGAEDHRPVLDHLDHPGVAGDQHAEDPMRWKTFERKSVSWWEPAGRAWPPRCYC